MEQVERWGKSTEISSTPVNMKHQRSGPELQTLPTYIEMAVVLPAWSVGLRLGFALKGLLCGNLVQHLAFGVQQTVPALHNISRAS